MDRWRGRIALVTGASCGIGYTTAEALAVEGMVVVACARNIAKIEELAKSISGCGQGKIYPVKCDLTKEADILQMFQMIEKTFQHVDILVNNAGMAHPEDLLTGRTEKWRGMIDLNILGVSICAREALRLMEQDKVDDGHIININSLSGHEINPHYGQIHFYAATKHMLTAMTKALHAEIREKKNSKIRVTSISPAAVKTEFMPSMAADSPELQAIFQSYLTFPLLSAKDVKDAILFAIAAPAHVCIKELILAPTELPTD